MSINKSEKLQCTFVKLSEDNQLYIIGLVEGLKYAQGNTNGKLLVKKEVIKYIERDLNDIC
jgi:hypothetical protein